MTSDLKESYVELRSLGFGLIWFIIKALCVLISLSSRSHLALVSSSSRSHLLFVNSYNTEISFTSLTDYGEFYAHNRRRLIHLNRAR